MKRAWLLKCISALLSTFFITCCCLSVRAETQSEALNKRPVGIYDAEFDEGSVLATVKQNSSGIILFSTENTVPSYLSEDFEALGISDAENLDIVNVNSISVFSAGAASTSTLKLNLKEPSRENVIKTIEKLNELPYVEYAEPNYIRELSSLPDDFYYTSGNQYNLTRVNAEAVWDMDISCSDIAVAVIDTGTLITHVDLKDNIWINEGETADNKLDDDGNGFADDINGWNFYDNNNDLTDHNFHGTHVAGIVSAMTGNSKGVASVARNAKIATLKVFGSSNKTADSYIIKAIKYAGAMNFPIVNCSFGGEGYSQEMYNAIAAAPDTLFVTAAGNESSDNDVKPVYPASYELENVISVAATDKNDNLSSFSNYGAASVDVAAPGSGIASTYCSGTGPGGNYAALNGTSQACPLVSSTAAVVKSKYPGASPSEIINKIKKGVDKVDSLEGKVETAGILNAYESLLIRAESVKLTCSSLELSKGESVKLTVKVLPNDTTDTIVWNSDNEKAASVEDGNVTANGYGTAVITAVCGRVQDKCVITVAGYPIEFEPRGGEVGEELPAGYCAGDKLTLPIPTKIGYTFGGWFEDENCDGEKIVEIKATDRGAKKYYAKWTANIYDVTLNPNGGDCDELTSYTYGETTPLPIPTKIGYSFDGWYDNVNCDGDAVVDIKPTDIDAKKYYAKWTANIYDVTLNPNGGECDELTSYTYGETTPLPIPTKTGHKFDGWYDNVDCDGDAVVNIKDTDIDAKEYYAKWTANIYDVTLNPDGGECDELTSYTYGETTPLPIPTKIGYSFDGWYDNVNCDGDAVVDIKDTDIDAKEYYAKWTANIYDVTLNPNGGECDKLTSYTYGETTPLPIPTKTGYTFDGWYDNVDCEGDAVVDIKPTDIDAKEYYAKWTANTYTVTLNPNGGECEELTSYTYGETTPLPIPTKIGYTFDGWYEDENFDGNVVVDIKDTDIDAKEYYAKWTANTYTVTLNPNGGECEDLTSYTYGKTTPLPIPTKIGHTFEGWYDNENFDGNVVVNIKSTDINAKEYYAKWTVNIYDVTLNPNGGECDELTSYTYGETTPLPIPTKTGYTFDGWYDNENFDGDVVVDIKDTDIDAKEYYAKWTVNKYLVTFMNYNDEILQSGEWEFGTVPVYNGAQPEKPNDEEYSYSFDGWDADIAEVTEPAIYTALFKNAPLYYSAEYYEGGAVIASPSAGIYCVIFAAYKNDILISTEVLFVPFDEPGERAVNAVAFDTTGADTVKVMLWNTLDAMKPLCVGDTEILR